MRFGSPWWLLALVLVPLVWPWGRARRTSAISFPSLRDVAMARIGHAGRGRRMTLGVLRVAVVALVVGALARPQLGREEARVYREGVDIVLAVDVSGSMLAEDFTVDGKRVSRLEAVKNVVREFIAARPNDRIGLVLFAGRPYTQAPLTLDHGWLNQHLARAEVGMIEDGTAVGSALATAVNRLRPSTVDSKFVVLLTDGQNNAGRVSPGTAAEAAASLGVTVYTVGAGTRGMAPFPARDLFGNTVYRPVPVDIDEETLKEVAVATGGRYFRATDTTSLRDVYTEIDRAERVVFDAPVYHDYREIYPWLAWPALALLLCEIGLGATILRKLP
jgi:Ca-activated chloride channel family protein